MKVSRWGGSLAIRLPKAVVERLGVVEGDDVVATEGAAGGVELHRRRGEEPTRSEAASRLAALLDALAPVRMTLPADYRFNRDDANER